MAMPSYAGARSRLICHSLPWLFLATCCLAAFHGARQGWDQPLLDLWRFRETQTAFAVRDFVEHGFHLDYQTPVLGAPWSIPFEFPTYQGCVALLVKVTSLPVEPAGRWVSLFFAYGSFALLGIFVWRSTDSWASGVYSAGLTLVSPVYIYGARAFMIETTALFLTLALLVAVQEFLRRPRLTPLLWALLAGALAGPTKGTTYAIGLVGIVGLLLRDPRGHWQRLRSTPHPGLLGGVLAVALALPFGLTLLWTHYTDVVKSHNELAGFLTSSALREWNFGTWPQRLDVETWSLVSRILADDVLGLPIVWVLGAIIVATGCSARSFAATLGLMFLAGLLVFTNLYRVHNYYHLANGLYLLALFGLGLGGLWDRGRTVMKLIVGLVLAPALAALLLVGYVHHTLPRQLNVLDPTIELANAIKRYTPPGSAIIVYGSDWDSALPYYAERHAIMERDGGPPEDPVIQRALARLDRPLAGVVFRGNTRDSMAYVQRQLTGLQAAGPRVFSDASGDLYLIQPSRIPSVPSWRNLGFAHLGATYESAFNFRLSGFQNRNGMMVHAPGVMKIARSARNHVLRFAFGMEEASYTGGNQTDGVTFIVDFLDAAGQSTRLFERRLTPLNVMADRGSHSVELTLPPAQAGTLLFRSETGPSSACDWAVWHDVQLQ